MILRVNSVFLNLCLSYQSVLFSFFSKLFVSINPSSDRSVYSLSDCSLNFSSDCSDCLVNSSDCSNSSSDCSNSLSDCSNSASDCSINFLSGFLIKFLSIFCIFGVRINYCSSQMTS